MNSEKIDKLIASITPYPWTTTKDELGCKIVNGADEYEVCFTSGRNNEDEDQSNADFIASAPEIIETLLRKSTHKDLLIDSLATANAYSLKLSKEIILHLAEGEVWENQQIADLEAKAKEVDGD